MGLKWGEHVCFMCGGIDDAFWVRECPCCWRRRCGARCCYPREGWRMAGSVEVCDACYAEERDGP